MLRVGLAGKSAIVECLAAALTELGTKHAIWRMNPKAITAPQVRSFIQMAIICILYITTKANEVHGYHGW